jgi:hypothetical protein
MRFLPRRENDPKRVAKTSARAPWTIDPEFESTPESEASARLAARDRMYKKDMANSASKSASNARDQEALKYHQDKSAERAANATPERNANVKYLNSVNGANGSSLYSDPYRPQG